MRTTSGATEPSSIRGVLAAARGAVGARLARALELPITLVAAPAGFDRSVLIHDHLRRAGQPYAHAAIDPVDAGMLGLLRALAEATRDVAPGLAASFVSVFDRLGDVPDAPEQLAAWAAGHLEAVSASIFVDGLDRAEDGRVAALLATLIDRTAGSLRWIVVAATGDAFPVARWLAEGRMTVPIDAADLALSAPGVVRAARLAGFPLRPDRLRRLVRLAAGWPAAVALGIAAGNALDLASAPADRAALYAYVADAAFAALSGSERAFVEATCLFQSFDAALLECAGLTEPDDTLARLATLGVLAAQGGSYRYDSLFGAFVRERIRARGGGAFERLAAATARAYERDERYAAALALYVDLEGSAAIGELLSAHGFRLIDRGEAGVVQRALHVIPHDVLVAYPAALAVKASLESLHGKFDVAEAWFRLALGTVGEEPRRQEIAYRFGVDLVRRERGDALDLLEPVAAALDVRAPLAAPLWALLATAYASQRRFPDASAAIERALGLLPHVADHGLRAKIVYQASFVALALRDIAAAKRLAAQAHAQAAACFNYDVAARALSVAYNIAVDYDDDIAASRRHLEALAELGVRAGSRQLFLYATLCRYEIEVLAGDTAEIDRLNERLQSLDVFFSVLTTETLLPAQALQATWTGDFYRAYRLIEPSAEHQIDPERQAFRYAEIALYAAAAGLRREASEAADRGLGIARRIGAKTKTVQQTLAFIALTFVLLRRHARAAKLLADPLLRAGINDRLARFVGVVERLAARWASGTATDDLAGALEALEACDLGGLARMIEGLPLPETARSRSAQLTAAERDVLGWLAAGLSSREIALAGGRSVSRVDGQIASLCRKLGCLGRHHAVDVALDEGLLYDIAVPAPQRERLGA